LKFFTTFAVVLGLQIILLKSLAQWSFSNTQGLSIVFVSMWSLHYDQWNKSARLCIMSSKSQN